jgi:hypothetical protein
MARIEQTVTIKFDPKDLDRLIEAIRRGMSQPKVWTVDYEDAEPIIIEISHVRATADQTPTTQYLFIDGNSAHHWVPSVRAGRDRGWRQAFFLPGR